MDPSSPMHPSDPSRGLLFFIFYFLIKVYILVRDSSPANLQMQT